MQKENTMSEKRVPADFSAKVAAYESCMQELEALSTRLEGTLEALQASRDAYAKLDAWYFSNEYLEDYRYEEDHPLVDQPAGVFSEDGLYNLLGGIHEQLEDIAAFLPVFRHTK